MARLLDGKATAATIRAELTGEVAALSAAMGRAPGLTVVLVGEDPASAVYVRNKEKACEKVGIRSEVLKFPQDGGASGGPADIDEAGLKDLIRELNAREDVDGILIQLPLPEGFDSQACLELIDPDKDVDGFHPVNMGRLVLGLPGLRPCTPQGVIELLARHEISPSGLHAVVIGRSNIVGKPMTVLLGLPGERGNATVTMAHSRTKDLPAVCRAADLLVVAIGRAKFVTAEMVKDGAVVVDVGMNRDEHGKLCGDVDYEAVAQKASAITPVPGGVGPMTIAQLLVNTVEACKARTGAKG